MGYLLYIIAVILVIAWAIGFFCLQCRLCYTHSAYYRSDCNLIQDNQGAKTYIINQSRPAYRFDRSQFLHHNKQIIKTKIMDTGKILLGILAGVAAGAVLGILFAPEKGSVTRKKIATKTGDIKDGLKDKFSEFLDDISEKYDNVKEGVSDFTDHMKHKIADAEKEVKTAKE